MRFHNRGSMRARPSAGLALGMAGLAIFWACVSGPGTTDDGRDPLRLAIAQSEVEHVLAPTYAAFETSAVGLRDASAAWADALESGAAPAEAQPQKDSAREAWVAVTEIWQRAELMQVGWAGGSSQVVAGEDLRDDVYSWPTINPCRIDEELVAGSFTETGFFDTALVNVTGLDTLEYLIFAEGATNACPPTSAINQDGSWEALGADELERRRAAYATAVAGHVVQVAERLASGWVPGEGDLARWVTAPGEDGSPYENPSAFLDDLLFATFYVESMLQHRKLEVTAAELESPGANRAKEHALANLEGLRLVILGGTSADEGTGFDDFLIDVGEEQLAADLLAAIDEAIATVEAIEGTFADALGQDASALQPAAAATARIVELLDGEVATALRLRRPSEAAGDAD